MHINWGYPGFTVWGCNLRGLYSAHDNKHNIMLSDQMTDKP